MPKNLKPVGMSREDFDRLPPLITRKTFLFATGISVEALYDMVERGELKRCLIGLGTRGMYYKADAARICGYTRAEYQPGKVVKLELV
jgi:hypothetical protein